MKKRRILITGGAGFIGSHLAEKLISDSHIITIADDLSRGSLSKISHIASHISFVQTDLRILSNARRVTKNQDVVYNLAALNTGVDYDRGRTQKMFEENMLLQMFPLQAAIEHGVETFVQISSASIYSKVAMEQHIPTKEGDVSDDPETSKLGYALAKRMGENLARWYSETCKTRVVISRFTNVYGTGDHYDSLSHFIPTIISKFIKCNNNVTVFGSGNQKRSFLSVKDAVEALVLLSIKGGRGEAYNIDSQDEYSVKDIIYSLQEIMNKVHIKIIFDRSMPEGSKRRVLDNTKIRALGWKSKFKLLNELPILVDDISKRIRDDTP